MPMMLELRIRARESRTPLRSSGPLDPEEVHGEQNPLGEQSVRLRYEGSIPLSALKDDSSLEYPLLLASIQGQIAS